MATEPPRAMHRRRFLSTLGCAGALAGQRAKAGGFFERKVAPYEQFLENVTQSAHHAIEQHAAAFNAPPGLVPSRKLVDGPLLGNGDLGVALGGPPEKQQFFLSKNDFWSPSLGNFVTVGGIELEMPSLQGASYFQRQILQRGEIEGRFETRGASVSTHSFIGPHQNVLVTRCALDRGSPIAARVRLWVGSKQLPDPVSARGLSDAPLSVHRHEGFELSDVEIYPHAFTPKQITLLAAKQHGAAFKSRIYPSSDDVAEREHLGPLPLGDAFTLSFRIRLSSQNTDGRFLPVITGGETINALRFGLIFDRVWLQIGDRRAGTLRSVAPGNWAHIAGTLEGGRLRVYLDGEDIAVPEGTLGQLDESLWLTRDSAPSFYAQVCSVAAVTRALGTNVSLRGNAIELLLETDRPSYLITAIAGGPKHPNALDEAKALVHDLSVESVSHLQEEGRQWWRQFWARSFISIPDKGLERAWYGAHYVMASCSRKGKPAPGLFGAWVTSDDPEWSGDYHFNYNFEAPFWGLYAANHIDEADPYDAPVLALIPEGRRQAKELLKLPGVYYQVGSGPKGLPAWAGQCFHGQKSNAAYLAINMIMRFDMTRDLDYARRVAYPFLAEVGAFWVAYLEFTNGRYVVRNDAIAENMRPDDVNPIITLGLLHALFPALLQMAEALGVDEQLRSKWRHIGQHLSGFPVQEREGRTIFRLTEKGLDWQSANSLAVQHIFPAGAIGLNSDPKLLAISRDTIAFLNRWTDYNGFPTLYPAAARVGYDPSSLLQHFSAEVRTHIFRNFLIYHGGGGIEDCGGVTSTLNEMLLQSHQGVLRLFPCWPPELDASFGGLRANGGFLVSAKWQGRKLRELLIASEKGSLCRVHNPWGRRRAQIRCRSVSPEQTVIPRWDTESFEFETAPKNVYEIAEFSDA